MRENKLATYQGFFGKIRDSIVFEPLVTFVVIVTALMVGMKTYQEFNYLNYFFYYFDVFISFFFLAEILVRILAEKRWYHFFKDPSNVFILTIVLISLLPYAYAEAFILGRLIRTVRVMRLFIVIPELRILFIALAKAPKRISYIFIFMFIDFYIYAGIGCSLFKDIDSENWQNIM